MVGAKELYLCNSLGKLQEMAAMGDMSSFKMKSLCESGLKLFRSALVEQDLGDEEKAYLYFFKYVQLLKVILKRPDYAKDTKYYEDLFNIKKNMKKAILQLEDLSLSLEKRYKAANKQQESAASAVLSAASYAAPTPAASAAAPTLASSASAAASTPSSSAKKRENKRTMEDKAVIDNSSSCTSQLVTARDLYILIQKKCESFFILDVRPGADYAASHINHPCSISIPADVLRPGITAASIGKKIKVADRAQWERRAKVDKLIICDWQSEEFSTEGPAHVLLTALTKWDRDQTYAHLPDLLKGGFEQFRLAYPHLVTDPKVRAPPSSSTGAGGAPLISASSGPSSLAAIQYPDLDVGFMTTPSATPSPVRPQQQLPAVQYPALSDLNATPQIDRGTKPNMAAVGHKNNLTQEDLNAARLSSLSLLDTSASNISNSRLNNALADTTSLSVNSSQASGSISSRFNAALQEEDNSEASDNASLSATAGTIPKVDRSTKSEAVAMYEERMRRLRHTVQAAEAEQEARQRRGVSRGCIPAAVVHSNGDSSDNERLLDTVLAARRELADLSLEREREALKQELAWSHIRAQREVQAGEDMRQMLQERTEQLEEELERLARRNTEKEETEMRLMEELNTLREKLREKETKAATAAADADINRKAAEQRRLMEQVDRKRRERKQAEQERWAAEQKAAAARRAAEEKAELEQRRMAEAARIKERIGGTPRIIADSEGKERLKDSEDAGSTPKNEGLRRSYSSPNIAQLLDEESRAQRKLVPAPKFDRKQKPTGIVKRDFAGVWGTTKPGLTGLRNLGNTCYMNSIIQCVSNTVPLVNYFVTGKFEEDLNQHSETRGQVALEFAALLRSLWSHQYKSISPIDLKHTVGRHKSEFAGREQQDSHEFATKLLEWLHEDTNRIQQPKKMPEIDTSGLPEAEGAHKQWRSFLDCNQSIIVQLFCGQTKQSVRCLHCGATSIKYQEFNNLTLPIPTSSNAKVSLSECFAHYLREDKVEWSCEKCRVKSFAIKKMDIVKFPPLLIIQLERFYPDPQMVMLSSSNEIKYRKKQNFVTFPLTSIKLGDFALDRHGLTNNYSTFNLYAVSNHFGTLEGGHYTAYCHSNVMKRWYKYDDQDVSSMDSSDVVSPAAYILFFSAVEDRNSLHPLG